MKIGGDVVAVMESYVSIEISETSGMYVGVFLE